MPENKNEITLTGAQAQQSLLVKEVESAMSSVGCDLTPYGVKCAMNAIAGAISFLKSKDKDKGLKDINLTLFKLSVQQVAVLELNYASYPSEVYFDLRGDILTIKAQGSGNEKLVRKYGVGIKPSTGLHKCWLIREGDEFTLPSYNGIEITPPTWKPKSYDKKVIMVVYPVEKVDGSVEYLIADREGIKPNIVAQIRQNALYAFHTTQTYNGKEYKKVDSEKRDAFYEQLNKDAETMSVEELLNCEKYEKYINPTYTSVGSKEAMIIRKMQNNALKNYPREYDTSYVRDAVAGMYEDNDDSLKRKYIGDVDATEKADADLDKPQEPNAPKDFDVNEDGEIVDADVKETSVQEPKPEPKAKEVEKPTETAPKTDCKYF